MKLESIPGLQKVKLGEVVPSISINRADVAEGTTGRAILLSKEWYAVSVTFVDTEKHKGQYLVNQKLAIKYGLRAYNKYICPCARLDTGADGDIVSPKIRIEYLSLSEQSYKEFANDAREMGTFETVALSKLPKGKFSYVKVKASNRVQDEALMSKVKAQVKSLDTMNIMKMILADVAHPMTELQKIMGEEEAPRELESYEEVRGSLPESFSEPAFEEPQVQPEDFEEQETNFTEVSDEFAE